MRRICCVVVLAFGAAAVLAGGIGAAVAAAPVSDFAAVLADNGSCQLTVTATWKHARVDKVSGGWYVDGAFRLTSEAPGVGGTLSGHSAALRVSLPPAASTHAISVDVRFFYRGAQVGMLTTNSVTAACS